jgi:cell division protein FtsB
MINWDVFEFCMLGLLALFGFFLRLLFTRLDSNARMLVDLHAKQAATHEQIVSLFRQSDKLEAKVDELLKGKGK